MDEIYRNVGYTWERFIEMGNTPDVVQDLQVYFRPLSNTPICWPCCTETFPNRPFSNNNMTSDPPYAKCPSLCPFWTATVVPPETSLTLSSNTTDPIVSNPTGIIAT